MIAFAETCAAIASDPSKLAKVEILANYLLALDNDDLEAATRFFTGNPFPARDNRTLAVGGRTLIAAAQAVWGVSDAELAAGYRASGDLAEALARWIREPSDLGLFRDPLHPATLKRMLYEIAAASGKHAAKRRLRLCEQILAACSTELEARYVLKIVTGELRIGLREGLVADAVARAFGVTAGDVRRAAMACGDIGLVAVAARRGTLGEVAIAYGSPIGFMLASPIAFGSSYRELASGAWFVEDKYDGMRVQAHKRGPEVRLFSRALNDVSAAFPELTDALGALPTDCILDGEIVAVRGDRVLPFRHLQGRLQRKDVSAALRELVPVRLVAFDVLAAGARFVLEEPLAERRTVLLQTVRSGEALACAPSAVLGTPDATTIANRFEAARALGNEGLVFKRADAPYVPGRRGKWWLKLKRELSTLDVVVVAVEWGHGKRAKVLSDYTFAVRGPHGELLPIGKAYSGLTDAEIAELTPWFLAHQIGASNSRTLAVSPEIVLEVAFDVVQRSALHASGFALRFPRIVRLRPDKPAGEIDSLADVERIYAAMLEREGVDG